MDKARNLLLEMLRHLDAAAETRQKQQVAAELDLAPSSLSNILKGRQRCQAEQLVGMLLMDDTDAALSAFAAARGYELRRVETPEEQLRRLRDVMRRELGPLADRLEKEAFGG